MIYQKSLPREIDQRVDDEPSLAESWIAKAMIERDHIAKYPDCADREYRECLIRTYERYALEAEAEEIQ